MHAINARLAGTLIAIAAASVLADTAARAQQFTMKLSQPTINDVVHEYYKALKAGVRGRADASSSRSTRRTSSASFPRWWKAWRSARSKQAARRTVSG
jgi:hypothetical protein